MSIADSDCSRSYVLVTPAYNEEALIGQTIRSVVAQTLTPRQWVIVSDGSTDRTDEIVRQAALATDFIRLLRIEGAHLRNWEAQVNGIRAGYAALSNVEFDFFGNLDADITVRPDYFERLIEKFRKNPELGLAGGYIHEERAGRFSVRRGNSTRSVPHAVQLFRRECYEAIGGYTPMRYGGPDWHAEVCVRMKGWETECFSDLEVFHHRPTGTAGSVYGHSFGQGLMDFSFGSDPLFEIVKCIRRIPSRPFALGAMIRFIGFCWGYLSRQDILVSEDFVAYLRQDQRMRLRLRFGSPDGE